jgi:hypothetical protein
LEVERLKGLEAESADTSAFKIFEILINLFRIKKSAFPEGETDFIIVF